MQTLINSKPSVSSTLRLKTSADATGDWNAVALVGDASRQDAEGQTVMPNRLKIELDPGEKPVIETPRSRAG